MPRKWHIGHEPMLRSECRLDPGASDIDEEEKGTGYFSGDVRGRPRWRSVESRPKVAAIVACQVAVLKGCCRFTQVRRAVSA